MVFTDRIVLIALAVGIYRRTIFVGKYRGNPSQNKRNLKKLKSTMTCNLEITVGFKQRKLYSDMSIIPMKFFTDIQMKTFRQ